MSFNQSHLKICWPDAKWLKSKQWISVSWQRDRRNPVYQSFVCDIVVKSHETGPIQWICVPLEKNEFISFSLGCKRFLEPFFHSFHVPNKSSHLFKNLTIFFSCVCVGIGLFSRFMWISNEVAKSNPWFPFLFAAFFSPYSFFHIFSWIIRTYQTVEGRKKREKKKKLSPTTSKAAKQFQQE